MTTKDLRSLTEKLAEVAENSKGKMPSEVLTEFSRATEELKASEIEKKALKVCDKAPSFKLNNGYGKEVDTAKLLENGPLVINFYRGKWCPYCNLELQEYMMNIDKIKELGANFIAVSPELPDESLSDEMPFDVLSDLGSKVAKEFNLVFEVDEKVNEIYKGFGIDLEKSNGVAGTELPMPATYVIDRNGEIVLAFANADYTKRLDVQDVLDKLAEIK
ncbi:MAG: peroxiredoxin-like family protein [Sarcina sp.]